MRTPFKSETFKLCLTLSTIALCGLVFYSLEPAQKRTTVSPAKSPFISPGATSTLPIRTQNSIDGIELGMTRQAAESTIHLPVIYADPFRIHCQNFKVAFVHGRVVSVSGGRELKIAGKRLLLAGDTESQAILVLGTPQKLVKMKGETWMYYEQIQARIYINNHSIAGFTMGSEYAVEPSAKNHKE